MTPAHTPPAEPVLVVDGNNVVGSRPDGWWRDPAGAAGRLVGRLRCYHAAGSRRVVVVFDAGHAELGGGGVDVVPPRRRGRGAADDRIVELLGELDAPAEVVTSDRELARRCQEAGAVVRGAGWLLRALDAARC